MGQELSNTEFAWRETIRKDFSDEEWEGRERDIATIKNWKQSTTAAAKALVHVKENNLARHYKSWKQFCETECGITRQWANQLIIYAKVIAGLPEKRNLGLPPVKAIIELSKHPQDQHVEILDKAEKFYSKDGKITGKAVKRAAVAVDDLVDQTDFPIPSGDASYYWSLLPDGKELAAKIHAIGMIVKALDENDTFWIQCDLPTVLIDLRNAWKRLKGGLPAYVCTKCGGVKPKGCDFCKGRGTVGTWAWRNCGDDKHAIERAVREERKKNARSGS